MRGITTAPGSAAWGLLMAVAVSCGGSGDPHGDAASDAPRFDIVVLPDTQYYAELYPEIFHAQIQWAVRSGARFLVHVGDVTNKNTTAQWGVADAAMARLDGVVPYAIALGNHDMGEPGSPGSTRNTENFNAYFPPMRFAALGGSFDGSSDNTYHLFSAGGVDWLVLGLEFGPRDQVITWANDTVARHPRRRVIIVTHAYMYDDDTRLGPGDDLNPNNTVIASEAGGAADGEELWDGFVRLHAGIRIVLSGHTLGDGTGRLLSYGDAGNPVLQILANYQMHPMGGGGYLRILRVDTATDAITVEAYSPWLDEHNLEPDHSFTATDLDL